MNLVMPGRIPSERHADAKHEEMVAYVERGPMRRMGHAPDIGRIAAFICSEGAAYLTGQKIAVNGRNTLL